MMPSDVTGMILLADNVYRTDRGKFVIAGTYTSWQTTKDVMHMPGVQLFVRLVFERFGQYECQLVVQDRSSPPTALPMLAMPINIEVSARTSRLIEAGFQLPELNIPASRPFNERPPTGEKATLIISMMLGHDVIASTNLDIIFNGPTLQHQAGKPMLP